MIPGTPGTNAPFAQTFSEPSIIDAVADPPNVGITTVALLPTGTVASSNIIRTRFFGPSQLFIRTDRLFNVLTHGSPLKKSFVGEIEHDFLPRQAADTIATLSAALQDPAWNGPGQLPEGVPNEAKVTLVNTPFVQTRCNVGPFSELVPQLLDDEDSFRFHEIATRPMGVSIEADALVKFKSYTPESGVGGAKIRFDQERED